MDTAVAIVEGGSRVYVHPYGFAIVGRDAVAAGR